MLRKSTNIIIFIYSILIFFIGLYILWFAFFKFDSFVKYLFAEIINIDIWLLNWYVFGILALCSGTVGIIAAILIWKNVRGSERFWLVLISFQLVVSFFQVGSYKIGEPDLFTIATVGGIFGLSLFAFSRNGISFIFINSNRYLLELLLIISIFVQVAGIALISFKNDKSEVKEIDVDQIFMSAIQKSFKDELYGSEAEKYVEFIGAYENKNSEKLIKCGEYLIKNGYENDKGILSHMAVEYYARGEKIKAAELLEASINGNYVSELAKPSGTGIHFEEGQLHYMLYTIYSETQSQARAKREHEMALDSFRKFLGDDYNDTKLDILIKASKSRLKHFMKVNSDTKK
jgi:hypothetical protein